MKSTISHEIEIAHYFHYIFFFFFQTIISRDSSLLSLYIFFQLHVFQIGGEKNSCNFCNPTDPYSFNFPNNIYEAKHKLIIGHQKYVKYSFHK